MSEELSEWGLRDRSFGLGVRAQRLRRGWTQEELMQKMQEAGLPETNQMTVSRIESGGREVRLSEAEALARIFDVSIATLRASSPQTEFLNKVRKANDEVRRIDRDLDRMEKELVRLATNLRGAMLHEEWPHHKDADPDVRRLSRELESAVAATLIYVAADYFSEGWADDLRTASSLKAARARARAEEAEQAAEQMSHWNALEQAVRDHQAQQGGED